MRAVLLERAELLVLLVRQEKVVALGVLELQAKRELLEKQELLVRLGRLDLLDPLEKLV